MMSSSGNKNLIKISLICVNRDINKSYSQQKDIIINLIRINPNFNKLGQIWQTLEKGVNYPVIHYLPLNDVKDFSEISKELEDFKLLQVLYEEIQRIELPVITNDFDISPQYSTNGSLPNQTIIQSKSAHIFLGFKTLDKTFNIVLEENWKDWTGARNIYLNLSSDFGLSKICFFRRIIPNDWNTFMYILIADCTHINHKNRDFLLDFVDRFRLQRLCGYLTVYTNISNYFPEIDTNLLVTS